MVPSSLFDTDLIGKYDVAGPRYTSYPTAPWFRPDFGVDDYLQAVARSNEAGRPLSLYVHIPFCDTVCFYCACNKVITRNRARATRYLESLHREIELQAERLVPGRVVDQLHFGGGTPTFISDGEMAALWDKLRQHFELRDDDRGEYAIEIDPRSVDREGIERLRNHGFNRLSMGVQDFNPAVQIAVNRIQPRSVTIDAIKAARQAGFHSISLDLIYGLPFQSVDGFSRTLDEVIELQPDRLSVFNYAHMPHLFKTQRQIDPATLPSPAVKLAILERVIDRLTEAGYVYIGMDHFARPDDDLALAQRRGDLYRNFQGYSTHAGCDVIGLGATAIGMVDDTYSQNHKDLESWANALAAGQLPVARGLRLDADDRLRRKVITRLICDFELDKNAIGEEFGIDFDEYFFTEMEALEALAADGLVQFERGRIRVLPAGRLLIRHVCMVFDRYLSDDRSSNRFSRVI